MRNVLQVLQGRDVGREFELTEERILLGRDDACRIILSDVMASRKHALLVCEQDTCWIEDLGSRNHTYVNDQPIQGRAPLKDSDRVKIGETVFLFRSQAPRAGPQVGKVRSTILGSMDVRAGLSGVVKVNADAKLRAMLHIADVLRRTLDLETVLSKMLDGLLAIFPHADRGLVLLLEQDRLIPRAMKHRFDDQRTVRFSRTIIEQAMRDRQAILSEDAVTDSRLALTQSIESSQIRSVMCAPLLSQERKPLGVIQLDNQNPLNKFDDDDMQILVAVANQAAATVEYAQLHKEMVKQARLQKEMDLARQVQRSLLPKEMPNLPGYGFWAHYLPAGKVGGDQYDFFRLPDGRQAVLLGDASGKGVPAALLMSKASAACRIALLEHPGDLAQAMYAANNEICDASLDAAFVTLALCLIDPHTHRLAMASAGHMSPMVRRADGTVEEPASESVTGYPFGIERRRPYTTCSAALGPGESVLLYSDGITDAMNGQEEMYSDARLRRQLAGMEGKDPSQIGQSLLDDVERHTAGCEQFDDISLVVFQRAAEGESRMSG